MVGVSPPATGPKKPVGGEWTAHLVNSIRPVLGFQAESRVLGVCGSTFALQGAIQVVPSVKLNARLGGVNLHGPAAGRVENPAEMPVGHDMGMAEWASPGCRGGDPAELPAYLATRRRSCP